MANIILYYYLYHTVSVGKVNRQITCIHWACAVVTTAYAPNEQHYVDYQLVLNWGFIVT